MKKYTFAFLRDYMSAKGISLEKVKGGYVMKDHFFTNMTELRKHIISFY